LLKFIALTKTSKSLQPNFKTSGFSGFSGRKRDDFSFATLEGVSIALLLWSYAEKHHSTDTDLSERAPVVLEA
jgi:hypothetical protein